MFCRKLKLELNEVHAVIVSGDRKAISDKIAELYKDYEKYGKTSKKIIDRYSLLALDILGR